MILSCCSAISGFDGFYYAVECMAVKNRDGRSKIKNPAFGKIPHGGSAV